MIYTLKIKEAIRFSIETHEVYQKQKRKGKDIAYITHPLTVGIILARIGAEEDVVAAGILHDTIEDSVPEKKVSRDILAKKFGDNVADIVASVSEISKSLPWEERKKEALERINTFSHNSLLVKSADIISNATELIDDYEQDGEKVFARFNAPKEKLLLHYLRAITAITARWPENRLAENLNDLSFKLAVLLTGSTPLSQTMELKKPTKCILWNKANATPADFDFERVRTFTESSHFDRNILKCRECGQLYFHEFYEVVNFGDDDMYDTYIPVETEEEIKILSETKNSLELLQFSPRLQYDFERGKNSPLRWIGK